MTNQIEHLSELKRTTRNLDAYRGLAALPGGLVLLVIGAKLLFAPFDQSGVNSPSLFDNSGNLYWDIASSIAFLMFVGLVPIYHWYSFKVGNVIAEKKMQNKQLVGTIVAIMLTLGALALDYVPVVPISIFGIIISTFWLWALQYYTDLKNWFIFFFAIQLSMAIAGPFIFAELKQDILDYMRHLVGLCLFTGGCLTFISGIVTHRYLMMKLQANRNQLTSTQHE